METKYSNTGISSLWIFLSGFYLTQLTPISPVYIAFFCFFSFVIIQCLYKISLSLNFGILLTIPMVIYLLLGFFNSEFNMVANFIISLLSSFITYYLFRYKRLDSRWVLFSFFLYAILFNADGIWRMLNPEEGNLDKLVSLGVGFQIYKYNSIMYSDSNFVGLQNLFVLCGFVYLLKVEGVFLRERKKIAIFIVFLMIISLGITFSRSAIFSCLLFFIFLFFRERPILKLLFLFSLPIVLFWFSIEFYSFFSQDVSFRSKFLIFELTLEHFMTTSFYNIIFGVGLGNAVDYIGIGAHSLLLTLAIELGVLGLFFFSFYIIYLVIVFKYDFTLIVLPFIVASFSLGSTAIPYFFTIIAFLLLVKRGMVKFR